MTPPTLLLARWVAPMDRRILRDGGVVFDDRRIIDVGPARALRVRHPDARIEDLGAAVILPGLVNAHTHLELSSLSPPSPPSPSFVDWVLQLLSAMRQIQAEQLQEFIDKGVRDGAAQCLRFGVTAVGDVTRHPHCSRPALASSLLRAVSFGEVVGMAGRRHLLPSLLDAALDRRHESQRLTVGLEPHAPYSLDLPGYEQCVEAARREAIPITTHLAETPQEGQFLSRHQGELCRLWDHMGEWSEGVPRFDGGPIRAMQSVGLLDLPAALAHVNYCDDDELNLLAQGSASVVYCPRTHAYFDHPPHRWREMLARGINVAVGTDSCASSPDLNLVDDLRLLHRLAPDLPAHVLWEMATLRGARALGQSQHIGSLAIGRDADIVVFPASTDDPLREVLESDELPSHVWLAGQRQF